MIIDRLWSANGTAQMGEGEASEPVTKTGKTCCLTVAHTVRSISITVKSSIMHAAVSLLTSIWPSAAVASRDSLINEKTTEVSMQYL